MTRFVVAAYLSPLVVGFGTAAVLALTRRRPAARRLLWVLAVTGAMLSVLAVSGVPSWSAFGAVACLLGGFALLVGGLFLFCEALRLPAEVCQIVSSLAVVTLMTTVFWLGPVLDRAAQSGMAGHDVSRAVALALDINPYMVMGYSVFGDDMLHHQGLYRLGLADYPYVSPRWQGAAASYALAGISFLILALVIAAVRPRLIVT